MYDRGEAVELSHRALHVLMRLEGDQQRHEVAAVYDVGRCDVCRRVLFGSDRPGVTGFASKACVASGEGFIDQRGHDPVRLG